MSLTYRAPVAYRNSYTYRGQAVDQPFTALGSSPRIGAAQAARDNRLIGATQTQIEHRQIGADNLRIGARRIGR